MPTLVGLMAFLPLVGLAFSALNAADSANRPPNIILILVDDLGWTDLSCMGSSFYETPNIDKLAAQAMKFAQAYSACTVCSPTRAAILTGKYPARLHITDWIEGHKRPQAKLKAPDWTMYLPHQEITLSELLKEAGYVSASIGKWHLGREPYHPDKQGFDLNIGGDHRGQPPSYFAPYKIPILNEGPAGESLTDRESAEALKFIQANKDRPFFLYLAHYAVHTPLQAKKEATEKYRAKAKPDERHQNPVYAAMIEGVDDSVGRLLKLLEGLKLADRTVIIFTSDNGGLIPVTSNVPLRAGKGSAYEGGVRVPLIVKWPGAAQPGSTNNTPVISMDLYATVLEIVGLQPAAAQIIDGESLVPLLRQSGGLERHAIYWHYPHYHPGGATPYAAVRAGDLKLVEFYEAQRLELYDLGIDISEKTNLANQLPARAGELLQMLHDWQRKVGAQMPLPNSNYDPDKEKPPEYARGNVETDGLNHKCQ